MSESVEHLLRKLIRQSSGVVNECAGMAERLKEHLFDLQLDILNDKSRFKLLNCGRRWGKSTLAAIKLTIPCLKESEVKTCYASTTKANAKSILWTDLINILETHNIPHTTNVVECTITFPNKSKIVFAGLHDKRSTEELRGKKYLVVIIDEAAFIGPHLSYAIDEVLRPTLTDYEDSQLWLMSTPIATLTGVFYDEWANGESKYKKYSYDFRTNPSLPRWKGKRNWKALAEKVFAEEKAQYEKEGKLNKWLREFEAAWIKDTELLVFPHILLTREIPDRLDYYIGIDVGWSDETAIVVLGLDQAVAEPKAYIVETWAQSEVPTGEIAQVLQQMEEKYSPIVIAADSGGGGKRLIGDLASMYGLNISAADKPKHRKQADIAIISDLLRSERMLMSENCQDAYGEFSILQYDDKREIDKRFPDHLADALVYVFREVMSVMSENEIKEPVDKINDHSVDHWQIELMKRINAEKQEQENLYGYEEY